MKRFMSYLVVFVFYVAIYGVQCRNFVWHYECNDGVCNRTQTTNQTERLSFAECTVLCTNGSGLWPLPTGNTTVSNLTEVNLERFSFQTSVTNVSVYDLTIRAFYVFLNNVRTQIPGHLSLFGNRGKHVNVTISITNETATQIYTTTNESYTLNVTEDSNGVIQVLIEADTFFGARHGLETLSQLIVFDDIRDRVLIAYNVSISDTPAYAWRGLLIDSSRNFLTVNSIKRTLSGMAASKLNILHWHFTDTASFPYVSKSLPYLSKLGAYSPSQIYTPLDVKEIVEYARVRGIRVVPEFDAPSHVGAGWQDSGFLTCFNWLPYDSYCNEPPCGQFDPTNSSLYTALESLYGDIIEQFDPEYFHMGGDEVSNDCWNDTDSIVSWMEDEGWNATTDGFLSLWNYFQENALASLYTAAGKDLPVILWSSDLTAQTNVTDYLPIDQYVIQVWTTASDSAITTLLDNNYTIILSNYDALYLDCGFGGWVAASDSWCNPYKQWRVIYENKPKNIAGDQTDQVLGGEAALWGEQVDSANLDAKLWPRAAAMAEVFWTEPSTNWTDAEPRMLVHRERLVRRGIQAEALQPAWCALNQGTCST